MNKKGVCLVLTVLLSVLGIYLFLHKELGYYETKIVFDKTKMPFIESTIQGKKCLLGIDLGSSFALHLKKQFLMTLSKRDPDFLKHQDFQGDVRYVLSYEIDDLEVLGKRASHFRAIEMIKEQNHLEECAGFMGMPLLEKRSILFDFPKLRMIAAKSRLDLTKVGYSLGDLVRIPFERTVHGIVVLAQTPIGTLRLLLDTGASVCCIKDQFFLPDVWQKDKGDPYLRSQQLRLGNQDFGQTDFYLYRVHEGFDEIDGVLGMEFLQNHILYIDHQENAIYLSS